MQHILLPAYLFLVIAFTLSSETTAQTITSEKQKFELKIIETDIQVPWAMAFLPNGDMLVTDKQGRIKIVRNDQMLPDEIKGVPPVYTRGQAGLFDVELHPDYKNNGWLYVSYAAEPENKDERGGMTYVMRAKLKDNTLVDQQILFKGSPFTTSGVHFGGRLEFDKEGYLFFSIGERGDMNKAQSLETYNGKVYRIKDDGSIPQDNPFVKTSGAIPAIYSYGHRNPQGLALNPWTGVLWETEHGPMGGDELNIVEKGKNYGWPVISYGINYDGTILTDKTAQEGMEQPVHYWKPSIATSNLMFVTSDRYPNWKGNILVCSLKFQNVERLEMEGNKVSHIEKIVENMGRVRSVAESPDGYIYVAVEGNKIIKIVPVK